MLNKSTFLAVLALLTPIVISPILIYNCECSYKDNVFGWSFDN